MPGTGGRLTCLLRHLSPLMQRWNKPLHFSLIDAGGIEKKEVVRTLRHFVSGDYMNSGSVHDEAQWRFALWTMKVHLTACY
jgi:hypothetical protein